MRGSDGNLSVAERMRRVVGARENVLLADSRSSGRMDGFDDVLLLMLLASDVGVLERYSGIMTNPL